MLNLFFLMFSSYSGNWIQQIQFNFMKFISRSRRRAYYVTHVFVMLCLQPCCNILWLLCTLFLTSWKCKWYFLCFITNDVNGSSMNLIRQPLLSLPDHLHRSSAFILRYGRKTTNLCHQNFNYYWYKGQKVVKFN